MFRTNTNSRQLIKHAKISYSIVSLVHHKFLYQTYRNGLNQVPQSWGTPSISKSTSHVSSILFVANPHFTILLHRVWYLQNLFMCRRTGHHFPGWVWNPKPRTRVHDSINKLFSSVCERYDFRKTKIWRQTASRWTILCLMLKVEDEQIYKIYLATDYW